MEVLPSLPLRRFPRQAPSYSGAGSVDASGGEVGGGAETETRWGPSKPQARPWRASTARQGARLSSERGPPCQLSWHGQRAVSPATSSRFSCASVHAEPQTERLSTSFTSNVPPTLWRREVQPGPSVQEPTSTEHKPTAQT